MTKQISWQTDARQRTDEQGCQNVACDHVLKSWQWSMHDFAAGKSALLLNPAGGNSSISLVPEGIWVGCGTGRAGCGSGKAWISAIVLLESGFLLHILIKLRVS